MVAAALEYPYVDSDKLIEERAGRTVAQIFAAQGEQAFRDLESSVLRVCFAMPMSPEHALCCACSPKKWIDMDLRKEVHGES